MKETIEELKERIEELEQQLAYECGCNAELVDTQLENEKLKMPKQYYILRVLDNDDNFIYETLLYDNKEDYERAIDVINEFDKYFYSEYCNTDEWYGGLVEKLTQENLLGLHLSDIYNMYVR